jgi:hypothetical protein
LTLPHWQDAPQEHDADPHAQSAFGHVLFIAAVTSATVTDPQPQPAPQPQVPDDIAQEQSAHFWQPKDEARVAMMLVSNG